TFERISDHLRYLTTVGKNNLTQTFETTDSHPFWVVTDKPDLSRVARETVEENGTILQHEDVTVAGNGYYVEAKDLKVGDIFLGANNELTTLAETQRKDFPEGITVYNFTVEGNHNYFVIANLEAFQNGASVVLVHNANTQNYSKSFPVDKPQKGKTIQRSTQFNTEGEARNFAMQRLGKKPVKLPDNKFRSRDNVWQFRAKPDDITQKHVHLEKLDQDGNVLTNLHLYFKRGRGQ
ncbi:MAG: HINT domain-containing protein, partial [Planctomycetaceae bacterium]|nr:HINT domain-containing protein [Planctomycetaceae bacterium]